MADPDPRSTRADVVTTVQSHTNWSISIGHRRLTLSRTRVTRSVGDGAGSWPVRPVRRRPFWPLAAGTFASVSAFGLVMAGALATARPEGSRLALRLPPPALPTALSAPVARLVDSQRMAIAPGPRRSMIGASAASDAGAEPHLAIAMRTGEFQEWTDGFGGHHYLTVGPLQADAGRRCRDTALLVRVFGGADRVSAKRRCLPAGEGGGVRDDVPAGDAGATNASGDPARPGG